MTPIRKTHILALLLLALASVAVACMQDPPPTVESLNQIDFHLQTLDEQEQAWIAAEEAAEQNDEEVVEDPTRRGELLEDVSRARERIDIAVSTLVDEELAQALVDARDRGVEVRVVGDWDAHEDAGFELLDAQQLLPVFGDGALSYLPEPTLSSILGQCQESAAAQLRECSRGQEQGSMLRPGDYNLMSHNFAVIDGHIVWTFPPPDTTRRSWVGWRIDSSQLAYDFTREFQQMHGGVFSTTLTVYNGPLKSTTDNHVRYLTDKGTMRLWFNPQERLMKIIIDEVYKAHASVWVMSDNVVNPDLIKALEYKNDNGFDVRIMAHEDHQAIGSAKRSLEDLGVRWAPEGVDHLPTLIIIDQQVDRTGRQRPRQVLALSHALIRAEPFDVEYSEPNDRVKIYPSDLFVDGNLWSLVETGTTVHDDESIDAFKDHWLAIYEGGE